MDRFHRAAKDGYLDVLKEATKRDCNNPDEDGMTPTMHAAYEGRMDALRLITSRGGDPDKCDHYGNTALHCAAARGFMDCVTFLVNFGCNIWALDNDFHTAKDLAAINNKDAILRFLDKKCAEKDMKNKKSDKTLKEKSQKDAEKRVKDFEKIKKKMDKRKEKDVKKLEKERMKMNTVEESSAHPGEGRRVTHSGLTHTPAFSELTQTVANQKKTAGVSIVNKKILQRKTMGRAAGGAQELPSDFKVGERTLDGKRSVRSLNGLRSLNDSEIMYATKRNDEDNDQVKTRGKITDVFDTGGELSRAISSPDFSQSEYDRDDNALMFDKPSMFARPGFGTMAFRSTMTATLGGLPGKGQQESLEEEEPSPGREPWDPEDLPSEDEESTSSLHVFLCAAGLGDFIDKFNKEEIDLDALLLLTDDDLNSLGLPLGPRRKLLKAVRDRQSAISQPGEVTDSRL